MFIYFILMLQWPIFFNSSITIIEELKISVEGTCLKAIQTQYILYSIQYTLYTIQYTVYSYLIKLLNSTVFFS